MFVLLSGAWCLLVISVVRSAAQSVPAPEGTEEFILQRYEDSKCLTESTGGGSQQSWMRKSPHCYVIMAGLQCMHHCNIYLTCGFNSGSGIMMEEMEDKQCTVGTGQKKPLFPAMSWPEALDFFQGGCIGGIHPDGGYVQFNKPMHPLTYPNCSSEGDAGVTSGAAMYMLPHYTLQWYADEMCTQEYIVNDNSILQSSRYHWKIYRGVQYCYDYEDVTPRPVNSSSKVLVTDYINFKLECKNLDTLGNGYMLEKYNAAKCTGSHEPPMYWREAFYPMNYPKVDRLFKGECLAWNTEWVKFDRAWDTSHYPDCKGFACTSGYCSGGRVDSGGYAGPYEGPIAATVQASGLARTTTLSWLAAIVSLLLLFTKT